MKLSHLLGGAALLLVLLVSLIATAPARLLSLVVPADQLLMQGFSGTVWHGSASRCMLRLPAGFLHLGTVQWSLKPLSLLLLSPRLSVTSEWGSQVVAGNLVLRGASDLDLNDLEARVSADLLRQFAPVAVNGSFSMQVAQLKLRDGMPYSGEGRIVWEQGGWQSPRGNVALGTYALEFEQIEDKPLLGEVLTVSGPLDAQGAVQLDGRQYRIDVLLRGDEVLDEQLKQALSLVAVPENDDFRILLEGDF